jgi:hypothetical protein
MGIFRRIIAALGPRTAPIMTPRAPITGTFAHDFSAFQTAVMRAAVKSCALEDDSNKGTGVSAAPALSHIAMQVSPDAPMTWRTGNTDTSEFGVGGRVVMTASVSVSPGPGFVGVVGESHYQDALQRAMRSRPGEAKPVFMAALVREPQNAYDANAVAVVIEPFGTVSLT